MPEIEMKFYTLETFKEDSIRKSTTTPAVKGNSYAIRLDWIIKSASTLKDKGQQYMHFIVRNNDANGNVGETLPPSKYTLWAEGVDDKGEMVVAEDFPPKIWP